MNHPPTLGPVLRYVMVMHTGSSYGVSFNFGRTDSEALDNGATIHPITISPALSVLNDRLHELSDLSVDYHITGETVIYHLHPCTVDNTEQYNKLLEHVDHIMKGDI